METQGFLSVIIPVYNGSDFLAAAVESVLQQQHSPGEIILIDDGSTDATAAVADRLQASLGGLLRYVYQPNAGPAAARNHGLALARGEWIAFLDADDLWPENSLGVRFAALRADPLLAVVMGRVRLVQGIEASDPESERENRTFAGPSLGAGLFRRAVFERVGGFDPALRSSEDVDWFLRARERGISIQQIPAVTLLYRRHEASLTYQKSPAALQMLQVLKRSLERRSGSEVP
ncbi:MAG: glycosyltransferase family 2 protein [Cytophagales bacterium]|nr:glycosyltransferase family 2 protein [Armatimonadota bacterium]